MQRRRDRGDAAGGAAIRLLTVLLQAFEGLTPEERYRALHDLFRDDFGGRGQFLPMLLLLAAMPLVLWLVYRLQRRRQGEAVRRPLMLLWELSGKAPLGLRDRLLLLHVARRTAQRDPAAMLFSANVYDRWTDLWTQGRAGRSATRLTTIRERLFGRRVRSEITGDPTALHKTPFPRDEG